MAPERRVAGNLPPDITSFVGRRQATAEVRNALSIARLVTLTGVGGVGKSRLALNVGRKVRRAFPDGVWLVELAKVGDQALVDQTVAAALQLRDHSQRDLVTVLAEFLVDKHLLLILDNCEHVREGCGGLVVHLLTAAPRLTVLATSREPLRINGELLRPVPPLSLPPTDSRARTPKGSYDGVKLFEDRAAAATPGFTLTKDNEPVVAQVCRRLDGLPLAIELAAVRTRVLSVEEMLVRLEDRFKLLMGGSHGALPRHQTLRATVEWSFELCSAAERLFWARCSVFAGDFDLAAAEHVCAGTGLERIEVFEAVSGLIDKSVLIRVGGRTKARYRVLETIRQYGRERLDEIDETDAVRRRHRDYYLDLAEQADVNADGPRQAEVAEWLQTERANLFAALDYCLTVPGEGRIGLRLAAALWYYWVACGFLQDGRYWFDRAITADTFPSRERVRALWMSGWIAYARGDISASLGLMVESHDLARMLGDSTELTYTMQFLGIAKMFNSEVSEAISLYDQVLARRRELARWPGPALILYPAYTLATGLVGDVDRAMALLAESRNVCGRQGEQWGLAWTLFAAGIVWCKTKNWSRALNCLRECLRLERDCKDQLGYAFSIDPLSWVAAAEGDWTRAAVLQGAVDPMWERIGTPLFGLAFLIANYEQARARTRKALGERAYQAAAQYGAQMPLEQVISYALDEAPSTFAVNPAGSAAGVAALTKREKEVATLIAQGLTNKEIATRLVIAQRTAEGHVERIFSKLGLTSRTQVVLWLTRDDPRRT